MNTISAQPKALAKQPVKAPTVEQQRSWTDKTMWLPEGMTCENCGHFKRCKSLGFAEVENVTCDFALSRFVEAKPVKTLNLVIDIEGHMRFIYDDTLCALLDEGESTIERASHVEPEGTQWIADLSPVNGPKLGPFTKRQDALDAEVEWLNEHVLV